MLFPTFLLQTELRSFFGLVNQLSASTSTISSLLAPLRPLLSTKNDFLWSPTHSQAFQAAKEYLTVAPVLSFFDIDKPTRLCTDASCHGLGFVLQQQNPDGKWCLTQAFSLMQKGAMSHLFSWITTLPNDHGSQSTDSHFKQSQAR